MKRDHRKDRIGLIGLEEDRSILAKKCDLCGSGVGVMCRDGRGNCVSPHAVRVRLSRARRANHK
jgi:hypothetical protein